MKTKKILVSSIFVLVLVAVFASPANAAWSNCNVIKVGPSGTQFMILLDSCDGKWTGNRWFVLQAACKKEMLATALTAMTNGWQVSSNFTSYTEMSAVKTLYLTSNPECN